jgi:hypothetical protein
MAAPTSDWQVRTHLACRQTRFRRSVSSARILFFHGSQLPGKRSSDPTALTTRLFCLDWEAAQRVTVLAELLRARLAWLTA